MKDFCETPNLENIVIGPTCFKNPLHPTSIDLMLTNIIRGFQNSVNYFRPPHDDNKCNEIVFS